MSIHSKFVFFIIRKKNKWIHNTYTPQFHILMKFFLSFKYNVNI